MKPINFTERNVEYSPSDKWDALPAYKSDDESISCWKPSFRERMSVLFIGRVWLRVMGRTQPPVSLIGAKTVFEVAADRSERSEA